MLDPKSKRRQFRELLSGSETLVVPGVYDCLSAKVVQYSGFSAAITTGAGIAASILGVPDLGLVTMLENLNQTRTIARSIDIPLVADCDTGYGNPINVMRTVQEFESIGVAALFLEDQVTPKRCGHFSGKQVISENEMVQKIRAAVDARIDGDLLLIARTDARAVDGVEVAIHRSQRYVEAGAEMLFVEAPETEEELDLIAKELSSLKVPLMVNLVEGGLTPLLPVSRLADMGFQMVTFSGSLQKTAIKAMQGLLESLRKTGSVESYYPSAMLSLEDRSELLGMSEFRELERRYTSDL